MSETDNAIRFMVEAQIRAFAITISQKDQKIAELEYLLKVSNQMVEQQSNELIELKKG